jgi:peptidoglycan hydrolase-like protein with peptidoglycan-binding domain
MNRNVYYCLASVALLVLTGCASFRLNMTRGYGPHYPPTPAPSGGAERWVDVEDWQFFLKGLKYLNALQDPHYPNGVFDEATERATRDFQATTKGSVATYALPQTGCVNIATYRKAVQEGMPEYHRVKLPNSCAVHPVHPKRPGMGALSTAPPDDFHDALMQFNCKNFTAQDPDVTDWQNFLVANSYMTSGTYKPGTFDGVTKTQTMAFQIAWSLARSGAVDHNTWNFANTFSNHDGEDLLSQDGRTRTHEVKSGCAMSTQ